MYTPAVLNHFKNPRNAGDLPDATAEVEVSNPACGDVLKLSIRTANGRIEAIRFKASGCVTAIACGSVLTELVQGKSLEEAERITAEEIGRTLGGLPAESTHGAHLARDALLAILAAARRVPE